MANDIMFDTYKSYFQMKLFSADDIKEFADVGYLSQDQANEILQSAK